MQQQEEFEFEAETETEILGREENIWKMLFPHTEENASFS